MNRRFTIPKLRWVIAGLLLAVTLINYVDRLTVSVLHKEILQSLNLSDADYSQIVSLFLVAYAIMYAGSGYVIDKVGTKVGMAIFVCMWSVSQMLHGLAGGKWSFAACRFALGLAEPGVSRQQLRQSENGFRRGNVHWVSEFSTSVLHLAQRWLRHWRLGWECNMAGARHSSLPV